mgnify:CR=1 FL=1
MKYMCILLASLFITSCASGPEAVAKSSKELAKCLINKDSTIPQSNKKTALEKDYKKIDDFKQKLKANCNEEEIKKVLKLTNCQVKECKKSSTIKANSVATWGEKCSNELNIDLKKEFTDNCFKLVN